MRKVFNNDGAVNAFVAGQSEGRNAGGSFFFENGKAFSYGYHYTVARIVLPGVILVSKRNSTATTNKLNGMVRWAAFSAGVKVIEVENVNALSLLDHGENIKALLDDAHTSAEKAKRARKEWSINSHLRDERETLAAAAAYRDVVGTLAYEMTKQAAAA